MFFSLTSENGALQLTSQLSGVVFHQRRAKTLQ